MKLLAATGNKNKLNEFTRILVPLGIEVISPEQAGVDGEVEETGSTFAENAKIKAEVLHKLTGIPAIADDSGLCVDALGGRPGVYSKRYMDNAQPHKQIEGLLKEMENVQAGERTARFTAAICCVLGGSDIIEAEESCEGEIAYAPSGKNGFGYDPIFMYGGRAFASLTDAEKDEVSHRGKALREFVKRFETYILRKSHVLEVKYYDKDEVDDSLISFVVIVSKAHGKWVFCKHRERDTLENPGGHRENGENFYDAAKRELFEETGAISFEITPVCLYSVSCSYDDDSKIKETFGALYYANITEFGKLPDFEIERVELLNELPAPENWTYPLIQPVLLKKADDFMSQE